MRLPILSRLSTRRALRARVFVYGTLRPGERAARMLDGSRHCGAGRVSGLRLYAGRTFPAVRREPGAETRGDVFECDRATLRALDCYEGAPILYRRERCDVRTRRGTVRAFVYVFATVPTAPAFAPMAERAEWSPDAGARARRAAGWTAGDLARWAAERDAERAADLARALATAEPETVPTFAGLDAGDLAPDLSTCADWAAGFPLDAPAFGRSVLSEDAGDPETVRASIERAARVGGGLQ